MCAVCFGVGACVGVVCVGVCGCGCGVWCVCVLVCVCVGVRVWLWHTEKHPCVDSKRLRVYIRRRCFESLTHDGPRVLSY